MEFGKKTTLNHKHWAKCWNSGAFPTDVWWIRTTQGAKWTRSNAKLCYFVIPCKILLTYRFIDKRAGGCSQKPDTQAANHDVFAIVAVAKVTEERGQKEKTADENWKLMESVIPFQWHHSSHNDQWKLQTQRCLIRCLIVCAVDDTWVCHALTLKRKKQNKFDLHQCFCVFVKQLLHHTCLQKSSGAVLYIKEFLNICKDACKARNTIQCKPCPTGSSK